MLRLLVTKTEKEFNDMQEKQFSWKSIDDISIHAIEWNIDHPKFVICLVHGMGEHVTRYRQFAQYFNKKGGIVMGYDQRGHGQSGGKRGHTPSYDLLLEEVSKLIVEAKTTYPDLPVFLYGHSMGGALVMNYGIQKHPNIKGIIASAPWISLAFRPSPFKIMLGKTMRSILPGLVQPSGLDPNMISTDAKEVEKYIADPLIHDKISVSSGMAMLDAGKLLESYHETYPVPLLIMHGDADQITSHQSSKQFAERVDNTTFKSWPGMFHEIHNEPSRHEVFDFTYQWMQKLL
jgi:alpha-beta hydrolase superfamily lysophospholipase